MSPYTIKLPHLPAGERTSTLGGEVEFVQSAQKRTWIFGGEKGNLQ